MLKTNNVSFSGNVNINRESIRKNLNNMSSTYHSGMMENYLKKISCLKKELSNSTPKDDKYSIELISYGKPLYGTMDKIFIDVIDENSQKAYILEMGKSSSQALAKLYTIQAGRHYSKPAVHEVKDIKDDNDFNCFFENNFKKLLFSVTGRKYHLSHKKN